MDRFAANTLRTLGIIVTSIFVIIGCLGLLLLALCFGILASAGGNGRSDPQTSALAVAALVAAAVLIAIGVSVVNVLAKGVARANASPSVPYTFIPPISAPAPNSPDPNPPASPVSDEARLDQALASYEARASQRAAEPPHKIDPAPTVPAAPAQVPSHSSAPSRPTDVRPIDVKPIGVRPIDVRHLSPASRTAIQQLAYAIVAKIIAEVVLGIVGWNGALNAVRAPFPLYRFGFVAWGVAAIAPHLVLLYALARRPGPRAFAYSLVIPSLHLLFGIFGRSAVLVFVLRAGQTATPLLSIVPLLLDVLILYLAWKAIRLTGIEPNPARLIVASCVILLYTSMLPPLVIFLDYSLR